VPTSLAQFLRREVLAITTLDGQPVGRARPGRCIAACGEWFQAKSATRRAAGSSGKWRVRAVVDGGMTLATLRSATLPDSGD